MEGNNLVSKIDDFLKTIERNDYQDAVDCFNNWVQNSGIVISNPDMAIWALNYIKRYMKTKKEFFEAFGLE